MTPTPEERHAVNEPVVTSASGERIVISGISGLFPLTHNVQDLSDMLYNKVDPTVKCTPRYSYKHPELGGEAGCVPNLNTFDAQFFKVNQRLVNSMDPTSRKLLEQAYQAIFDAGVNPNELNGKKVAVYVGSCFSENERELLFNNKITNLKSAFALTGASKTMFANRISYWLNTRGPSITIDQLCCSSIAALEQAFVAIKRGECEAAIIGGSFLCMNPQTSIHYSRIINLSKDGKTKSFDMNANGCGKSEAIAVLFLQKAKDAKRIYGEVLHVKTDFVSLMHDESGPKYGYDRNLVDSINYLKRFYNECEIDPKDVEYVEAMGCGTPEVDKKELETFEKVFCENKEDTLLVGSVMSNIGYSEAANGISAITKVLLGYHTGNLAANLHCDEPRQDVCALREGRMRIVTEHQPFNRGLAAVNGLSIAGINSHVLLHGNYKPKDINKYKSNIPHLVTVSGRNEGAVQFILDELKAHTIDPEQLALLHNVHRSNVSGHLFRGYAILDTDQTSKTVSVCERVEYCDTKRPLWFVYSGMGSQWAGMGAQLVRIPIFAAAIQRCHVALEPKGLNIFDIITSTDEIVFDNILHSFVGITAIQIGLTDVLRAVGLEPDGIIGHSVGELGCAYADGCLSAEETILAAYSRGLVSLQTPLIKGSMAAVGMGYKQILKLCPPEVDVACHNSAESSTISGPADVMRDFVATLTASGIFAKEVPCSNIAYHSRYIAVAGPKLLSYLKEVIKSPKPRSKRWVSTSVPESEWEQPAAQFCSPEYQTNNLLKPVLFEETTKHIPSDAVLVEVAPHGLLQAILKRSMPDQVKNIALTRRKHNDNTILVLQALGELYMEGFTPKLQELYPKIDFPVSTGTPFLSNLVKWAHEENWSMAMYMGNDTKYTTSCNYIISYFDQEHQYLRGNVIRGRVLYPFAASLVLAWDTLSMVLGVPKKLISVKFTELCLHTQPILHDQRSIKLNITLHRGTGSFEVLNDDSKVVTGYIQQVAKSLNVMMTYFNEDIYENQVKIYSDDLYKLFRDKDFLYSGDFQSLHSTNIEFTSGMLNWSDNWVTFIDGLLQLNTLRQTHKGVSLPTLVRQLTIDVKQHRLFVTPRSKCLIPAIFSEKHDHTRCGGVEIKNVIFEHLPAIDGNVAIPEPTEVYGGKLLENIPNYKLECTQIGDYESLKWVEAPEVTSNGGVAITVHYVGINLQDVNTANGSRMIGNKTKHSFGIDFSGISDSGTRVMGVCVSGAACRRLVVSPTLCWPVPRHWSLEDAATVPLAYTLAYYCLVIKGKLLPHHTVYVHGGCGALGQAVISLALASGSKVLTAVGDVRKKQFLRKLFPELQDENIGFSRDPNFSDFILSSTNGQGCDLLINTAVGEDKQNSIRACAHSGMVIDLTQLQENSIFSYGMFSLTKSRNYMIVDLKSIVENEEVVNKIQDLMCYGISRGFVRPLSRVIYDADRTPDAFSLLASSQHRGRVLLHLNNTMPQITPRMSCGADACHVVLCNGNELGLQMADRLVARGAKNLFVHYKNESHPYFLAKKRSWESQGVEVTVLHQDISNDQELTSLFKQVTLMGKLEGLYFITGGNLNDEKRVGNLDFETRKLNLNPKYFVVLCVGTRVAEDLCRNRIRCGFNAANLLIPNNVILNNIDIVETALMTRADVITAVKNDTTVKLVERILQLAGINTSEIAYNKTLTELGLLSCKIPSISCFLRNTYNIAYDDDKISSMTINSLLQLQNELTACPYSDTDSWSTFFNYVESDELVATTDLIIKSTLSNTDISPIRDFYPDETYLCIVPGMEGQHGRFQGLCERLKVPALVLQQNIDSVYDSLKDTAAKLVQVLLKKVDLKKSFMILGYETGVIVALEIAAILEEHGLIGTVFCLGYSPKELKLLIDRFTSNFASDEELQDSLLKHMCALISGRDAEDFDVKGATWEEKLEGAVKELLRNGSHTAQYTKALVTCALSRVRQLQSYNWAAPERPLRSKIVLMRAATAHAPEISDLQLYSLQKLSIHQLTTPLPHLTLDCHCAPILHSHLDPILLQQFEDKNTCDTYLITKTRV